MRILSAVVLVAVIVGAVLGERERVGTHPTRIGIAAALSCVVGLTIGHLVPRLVRVERARSVASAFGVGVHSSTPAIAVTIGVSAAPRRLCHRRPRRGRVPAGGAGRGGAVATRPRPAPPRRHTIGEPPVTATTSAVM